MPLPAGHVVTGNEFAAATNADNANFIGTISLPNISSGTYIDITGASKAWTKWLSAAASDIEVEVSVSGWVTVATTSMKVGIRIGSTDYDVATYIYNTVSDHRTFIGRARITGVAAGSYTPQLRVLRSAGTGLFNIDSADTVSFQIEEKIL